MAAMRACRIFQIQKNSWLMTNQSLIRCASTHDIPVYKVKRNENIRDKKCRLVYQSRKRGMLENCLLLSTFAKKYLDSFDESQLNLYDKLINLPSNDWDIYYWATGVSQVPEEFDNEIMKMLQNHAKNTDKEKRYDAPPLY